MDWWPIGLGFNTGEAIRRCGYSLALSYAVDRDEIVEFAFQGFSQKAALRTRLPGLQKYMDGVADQLQTYDTLKYDPGAERRHHDPQGLLKDGEGMWARRLRAAGQLPDLSRSRRSVGTRSRRSSPAAQTRRLRRRAPAAADFVAASPRVERGLPVGPRPAR